MACGSNSQQAPNPFNQFTNLLLATMHTSYMFSAASVAVPPLVLLRKGYGFLHSSWCLDPQIGNVAPLVLWT